MDLVNPLEKGPSINSSPLNRGEFLGGWRPMEFLGSKKMVVGLWLVLMGILAITAGVRGHHTDDGKHSISFSPFPFH